MAGFGMEDHTATLQKALDRSVAAVLDAPAHAIAAASAATAQLARLLANADAFPPLVDVERFSQITLLTAADELDAPVELIQPLADAVTAALEGVLDSSTSLAAGLVDAVSDPPANSSIADALTTSLSALLELSSDMRSVGERDLATRLHFVARALSRTAAAATDWTLKVATVALGPQLHAVAEAAFDLTLILAVALPLLLPDCESPMYEGECPETSWVGSVATDGRTSGSLEVEPWQCGARLTITFRTHRRVATSEAWGGANNWRSSAGSWATGAGSWAQGGDPASGGWASRGWSAAPRVLPASPPPLLPPAAPFTKSEMLATHDRGSWWGDIAWQDAPRGPSVTNDGGGGSSGDGGGSPTREWRGGDKVHAYPQWPGSESLGAEALLRDGDVLTTAADAEQIEEADEEEDGDLPPLPPLLPPPDGLNVHVYGDARLLSGPRSATSFEIELGRLPLWRTPKISLVIDAPEPGLPQVECTTAPRSRPRRHLPRDYLGELRRVEHKYTKAKSTDPARAPGQQPFSPELQEASAAPPTPSVEEATATASEAADAVAAWLMAARSYEYPGREPTLAPPFPMDGGSQRIALYVPPSLMAAIAVCFVVRRLGALLSRRAGGYTAAPRVDTLALAPDEEGGWV